MKIQNVKNAGSYDYYQQFNNRKHFVTHLFVIKTGIRQDVVEPRELSRGIRKSPGKFVVCVIIHGVKADKSQASPDKSGVKSS